jgi:MoxR-like ATPase
MEGRVAVAVDDIRAVAPPVLRHRLILGFEAEAAGLTADHFVARAIEETQVTE